jgi:hypothetical protein
VSSLNIFGCANIDARSSLLGLREYQHARGVWIREHWMDDVALLGSDPYPGAWILLGEWRRRNQKLVKLVVKGTIGLLSLLASALARVSAI